MKIRLVVALCLALAVIDSHAAEPPAAPAANPAAGDAAPAADAPKSAAPGTQDIDKAQLQQAFDGAMTCSALTAVIADKAAEADAWRWGNRSFAFGMLAVRFYTEANKKPLSSDELNNILTQYANTLLSMPETDRKPFDEGCARKYPDMDKLCEQNTCPRQPPGAAKPRAEPEAKSSTPPPTDP